MAKLKITEHEDTRFQKDSISVLHFTLVKLWLFFRKFLHLFVRLKGFLFTCLLGCFGEREFDGATVWIISFTNTAFIFLFIWGKLLITTYMLTNINTHNIYHSYSYQCLWVCSSQTQTLWNFSLYHLCLFSFDLITLTPEVQNKQMTF